MKGKGFRGYKPRNLTFSYYEINSLFLGSVIAFLLTIIWEVVMNGIDAYLKKKKRRD